MTIAIIIGVFVFLCLLIDRLQRLKRPAKYDWRDVRDDGIASAAFSFVLWLVLNR